MATRKKTDAAPLAVKHYLWGALAIVALIGAIVLFALDKSNEGNLLLVFLGGQLVPGSPLGGLTRRDRDGGPPTYGGSSRRGTADDPGPGWGEPTDRADRTALRWAVDVVALAVALGALGVFTSGCGAGALRTHAAAATVLTVATAGAGEVAVASVEAALGECSDEACVERIDREVRPAVSVAHESLRVGVIAYREAVSIAAAAEAGDAVLEALVVALARVVREWDALAAALSALLGEELPGLPPVVRGLLDALAGGGS